MKFEHMLYRQLVSEWRNCYIDYAGLKSIVEALSDYAKALRAKDLDQRLICEKRMASVFRQLTVEFSELYEIEWRMVKSFLEFKAC
jgi:SPX domain protein involved in polyphosphate accumulation